MPQWFTIVCAMFVYTGICNLHASHSFVTYYHRSSPNNHKINPKPCSVNGLPGTCMFVWQCINTDGKHIGMCVDTFMFGSCCAHNLTSVQLTQIADPSEPAVLYTEPQHHHQHQSGSAGKPFPTSAESSGSGKPSRLKPKPSSSGSMLSAPSGISTDRPLIYNNQIRPNNINLNAMMPGSIDRVQSGLNSDRYHSSTTHRTPIATAGSSTSAVHLPAPTPSQHFHPHYILPAHHHSNNAQQKPNSITTSQPSKPSSPPSWPSSAAPGNSISISTVTAIPSISFNTRPSFVFHISPSTTTTATVAVPLQHFNNYSSHYTTTTAESWNNQNLESNEIEDISNHIDGNGNHYQYQAHHPSWYTSSQQPPSFITKPRPPHPNHNKYKPWTISNAMYAPPSNSVNITKLQTTKPIHSTTTSGGGVSSSIFWASTTTGATPVSAVNLTTHNANLTISSERTKLTNGSETSVSVTEKAKCGISPLQPTRHGMRIVGGRNAQFGAWAWQVSVRRTSFFGFSSTHRCGGALLNQNWIATAGHCVDDLLTSQIRIRVGEYDFSSIQEPYPFAERGVARKVVHPKYNFFTYEYDLAMVKMDSPLEYAPHIVPICLPGSDDLLIGENATVTGWGRLSEGGTLPSVLQEVSVPIVSNDKCKSMFLRAGRHEYIPDIFMCAGFDNGGRDSCQGDSGGPLQVRGKDGRYFLAGIISWGIGCAEANLPGVCTRISKFVPWILETVT